MVSSCVPQKLCVFSFKCRARNVNAQTVAAGTQNRCHPIRGRSLAPEYDFVSFIAFGVAGLAVQFALIVKMNGKSDS